MKDANSWQLLYKYSRKRKIDFTSKLFPTIPQLLQQLLIASHKIIELLFSHNLCAKGDESCWFNNEL